MRTLTCEGISCQSSSLIICLSLTSLKVQMRSKKCFLVNSLIFNIALELKACGTHTKSGFSWPFNMREVFSDHKDEGSLTVVWQMQCFRFFRQNLPDVFETYIS